MTVKAYKVKSFHNGGTHDFLAFNQLSNVSASVRKKTTFTLIYTWKLLGFKILKLKKVERTLDN